MSTAEVGRGAGLSRQGAVGGCCEKLVPTAAAEIKSWNERQGTWT